MKPACLYAPRATRAAAGPLALALLVTLGACHLNIGGTFGSGPLIEGSGNRIEVERGAPGFRRLELKVPARAHVRVGESPSVRITGDDNLLPYVTTDVQGETLVIAMQPGHSYRCDVPLEIDISTPELEVLQVKGSGDVDVEGIQGESFEASVAGSGDLRLRGEARRFTSSVLGSGDVVIEVEADDVTLAVSGSGDFKATGRTDRLEATISGSGDMDLGQLESREASLRISGSGDMDVWATERLEIDVSGSGDVNYRGNPTIEQRVRGSGDVRGRPGAMRV